MNLYLDNIIFALQRSGGISVYWAELLKYLNEHNPDVRMLEHPQALQNIQRKALKLPRERIDNDSRLLVALSRYLQAPCKATSGIFHSSYYRTPDFNGIKQVVTVYDFTYELYRSGLRRAVHHYQKQRAIREAAGIICISESTKKDLLRLYPSTPESLITVIHLGISSAYEPVDKNTGVPDSLKWVPQTKFVLFVGDRSEYKNFDLAILSVSRITDCHLVIIGGGELTSGEQQLLESILSKRHRHLSGVADVTLNILYNYAFCLLYPSHYEGFGLPPLEAMQAHCPVVAVNCSSLPEVCGDAALLTDNADSEQFVDQLLTLEDDTTRKMMITRGKLQARKFTWKNTCEKTVEFYQAVETGSLQDHAA
jgi:mannosyltransferase